MAKFIMNIVESTVTVVREGRKTRVTNDVSSSFLNRWNDDGTPVTYPTFEDAANSWKVLAWNQRDAAKSMGWVPEPDDEDPDLSLRLVRNTKDAWRSRLYICQILQTEA